MRGKSREGYVAYVHFDSRREDGTNKVYYAAVIFADPQGKDIVRAEIKKYTEGAENSYLRGLQSYVNALDLIYKAQGDLISEGVTNVLLVFEGSTLLKWLRGRVPMKYKAVLDDIHSLYGYGGPKEIRLTVGVGGKKLKSKVYQYCNERYLKEYSKEGEYVSFEDLEV